MTKKEKVPLVFSGTVIETRLNTFHIAPSQLFFDILGRVDKVQNPPQLVPVIRSLQVAHGTHC